MTFGQIIQKARKEKHLTQSELASILGVTDSIVCGYEKGRNVPSVDVFINLCKTLKLSADEMIKLIPLDDDEKEGE